MDPISAARAAAVLGAVEETAGTAGFAAGLFAGLLVVFFFFAAARFRAAEVVCFFRVVWDVESSGATASPASSRAARIFSLRRCIELVSVHSVEILSLNTLANAKFTPSRRIAARKLPVSRGWLGKGHGYG
jgi:hypothetical protein